MSSAQSLLTRYRVVVVVAIPAAIVLSILAYHNTSQHRLSTAPLRRRNAVRRAQRSQDPYARLLQSSNNEYPLGLIAIMRDGRIAAQLPPLHIAPFPSIEHLATILGTSVEAAQPLYQQAVVLGIREVLRACNGIVAFSSPLRRGNEERLVGLLVMRNAMRTQPREWIADHYAETLVDFIGAPSSMIAAAHRTILEELQRLHEQPQPLRESADSTSSAVTDDTNSARAPPNAPATSVDKIKGILYYIAEEQAKRKAVQHRGIRCDECGEYPIRNVRWRCLNCPDLDLCSTCKSLSGHQKNHVFAEIKLPIPVLAQPAGSLPLWYPGTGIGARSFLAPEDRRLLAQKYGFEEPEIDAIVDQFCCMADERSKEPTDPSGVAISRTTFIKALSSHKWYHQHRTSLLNQKIYEFYHTAGQEQITLEQFVSGQAYIRGKARFETLERALNGFDLDRDGLIPRSHFLRLLKSKFDVNNSIVEQITGSEEAEFTKEHEWRLPDTMPIGTVFDGAIPDGVSRSAASAKIPDANGELIPAPGMEAIRRQPQVVTAHLNDAQAHAREHIVFNDRAVLGIAAQPPTSFDDDPVDTVLIWERASETINGLLDAIYGPRETIYKQVVSTREERSKWHAEIEEATRPDSQAYDELQAAMRLDPRIYIANHTILHRVPTYDLSRMHDLIRAGMAPTDDDSLDQMENGIENQPLDSLLAQSGYSVVERSVASSSTRLATAGNALEAYVDPTLPQNRPNTSVQAAAVTQRPPSQARLEYLAALNEQEERIYVKRGEVCLCIPEIEGLVAPNNARHVQNLIKSWLLWATF